jgi:hypothetical protein
MALQSLNGPFQWPGNYPLGSTTIAISATNAYTSGQYDAIICCAPKAMTISHVGFLPQAVSGSPTAEVRIETVDATTGLPTGTLWGTNTNGTTGTLTAGTFATQALTASASISAGDVFAVIVKYASGTSVTPGRIAGYAATDNLPYLVQNTGTPTKAQPNWRARVVGSGATSFYFVPGMLPMKTGGGGTFNNTNSAKRAMRFQVPFTCRCVGLAFYASTAVGDFNVILMDDAGADLGSTSKAYDGDKLDGSSGRAVCFFATPAILSPNTWYRAVVEPSSATNTNVSTYQLQTLDYRSGMPGGTNCHYATFASGSWTDTATDQVPLMDILIDQLDDGTGSGGGSTVIETTLHVIETGLVA